MRGLATLVPAVVAGAWLGAGFAAQAEQARTCPRHCGDICCRKDEVCAHGAGLQSKCMSVPSGQRGPRKAARPKQASAEVSLAERTPAELIELYVFHPDCGFRTFADPAAYQAALAQNRAITAELQRRGEGAAESCRQHLHDLRNIFDGDGGDAMNVASVCHDVLKKLGHPVAKRVEHRFCSQARPH